MKLSELIAATKYPAEDPEIIILRDWGELAPAAIVSPATLAEGDPVIDAIGETGGALILVADNDSDDD